MKVVYDNSGYHLVAAIPSRPREGERRGLIAHYRGLQEIPTDSFAKVLSVGNRELLQAIAKEAPSSLDELAQITGRAKSNLSRTLKTMAGYRLQRLERGDKGRITPKVTHDRVELHLPLTGLSATANKSAK